jgi:signal transduction histidine kinase
MDPAMLLAPNFKALIYRSARLRGLTLLGLLLLILAILGGMIWRNLERFETIRSYVNYAHQIQQMGLDLQELLTEHLSGKAHPEEHRVEALSRDIKRLIAADHHLAPETPAQLRRVGTLLADAREDDETSVRNTLITALTVMSQMADAETDEREQVLEDISSETRAELQLASGILITIFLLAGWFLRRQIMAPINDLKELLLRLTKGDFTPIATENLDPLLKPVFQSYNEMVTHLGELEEAKRLHAQSLEAEVRTATQALLEQQSSLAMAERLAAVGELAASLAHELRNPLAGIQMSCRNLRDEIDNPDQAQRLDLIVEELKRMTRLLNHLLEQGKHAPTPANDFNLGILVQDLLALNRYQIPSHITLESDVPDPLQCRLPESQLRQALLNLVLNAAQAMHNRTGSIRIAARQDQDNLWIAVTDDGPGFSREMLESGIRPFSSGRQRGTGLGLAIVQRFARELGGQIKLSNREPRGGNVTLRLPLTAISTPNAR